jgi:hypothetical protein
MTHAVSASFNPLSKPLTTNAENSEKMDKQSFFGEDTEACKHADEIEEKT